MKISELREMQTFELEKLLSDKIEALFNLRFQKAKKVISNPNMIRMTRRDIARIKTLLVEKK